MNGMMGIKTITMMIIMITMMRKMTGTVTTEMKKTGMMRMTGGTPTIGFILKKNGRNK